MPNLISLTHPSLQILHRIQTGVFLICSFLAKSLINKNCHNSRTGNDTDMKLASETKLDKRNTTTSKNLKMASCCHIMMSL